MWGSALGWGESKQHLAEFCLPLQLRFVLFSAFELQGRSACTHSCLNSLSRPGARREGLEVSCVGGVWVQAYHTCLNSPITIDLTTVPVAL